MLQTLLIALLLQAPPAAGSQAARSSVEGLVVDSKTGEPIANARVTLARTDFALRLFAELTAGDHPPAEITLPAEVLAAISEEAVAATAGDPNAPDAKA